LKILHLYNNWKHHAIRIQYGFVTKLQKYCEFYVYGPGESHQLAPIKYDRAIKVKDLLKIFNPDILLLHMWGCVNWIPKDFKDANVAKVMIEADYEQNPNKNLYKDLKLDLLIQRGSFSTLYDPPSVWLPWSANEKEFFIDTKIKRKNVVIFMGASTPNEPFYDIRRKALNVIPKAHLTNLGTFAGGEYPQLLREHTIALNGNGQQKSVAKVFEIMASGTVLLTNKLKMREVLFGKDQCYMEYKDDCSDLVKKVNKLLKDDDYRNMLAKKGHDVVHEHHLDKHRVKELYNILKKLLEGKEVERKWVL
jgi:spore maturation protein CgeB